MKKFLTFSSVLSLVLSAGLLYAADEISPVGVWKTIDDESKEAKSYVQVYEENGKVYGKIIKLLKKPDALCDKCDGSVFPKNTPVIGMRMIWDMEKKAAGDKFYKGGKIFDPNNGKQYRCELWREGNLLKVRGFIGPFFRTQTWHWVGDK